MKLAWETSREGMVEVFPDTSRKTEICCLSAGEPHQDAFRICVSRFGVLSTRIWLGVGDAEIRFRRTDSAVCTSPTDMRLKDWSKDDGSIPSPAASGRLRRDSFMSASLDCMRSPSPTSGWRWVKPTLAPMGGLPACFRMELSVVSTLDIDTEDRFL